MARCIEINSRQGPFIIREYKPQDDPAILSSWEEVFKQQASAGLWNWKYHENPAGFRTIICLSPDNLVAVHYAGQVNRSWFLDREILGLQLVDIFTHPKFRWAIGGRSGLFVHTAKVFWQTFFRDAPFGRELDLGSKLSKVHFLWGLPGKRHAILGQKTMGYGVLPRIFYAEQTSSPRGCHSSKDLFWRVKRLIPGRDQIPRGLDQLWLRFCNLFRPFSLVKDDKYIDWRYWKRPHNGKNYLFYILHRPLGTGIKAWLTLYPLEQNELVILDFLTGEPSHLEYLLRRVLSMHPGSKFKIWLSDTSPWKSIFLKAGFIQRDEPLGIVPSIKSYDQQIMDKSEAFHWVIGDSDLY